MRLEIRFQFAKPELNGRTLPGRVIGDVLLEWGIERADLSEAGVHGGNDA
jgi:hypothetical protein